MNSRILLVILILISNTFSVCIANEHHVSEGKILQHNDHTKLINDVRFYFQKHKSFALDFIQSDETGSTAQGKLLVDNIRFRFNYYPPYPLLIIGGKNYISIYDYEMHNVTRVKAPKSIFHVLFSNDNDLKQHIEIQSVEDWMGFKSITIKHLDSEIIAQLIVDTDTKRLYTIKILEDNNTIIIQFGDIETVEHFDNDIFILKNPHIFGPPKQFTQDEVKSIINK